VFTRACHLSLSWAKWIQSRMTKWNFKGVTHTTSWTVISLLLKRNNKCNNVIQGHCDNYLGSHSCKNVFKQLPWSSLLQQCAPTMPLVSSCCDNVPTMTTGHASCLVFRENATDRQTDMEKPIRCSSLMLKHKEHLKRTNWSRYYVRIFNSTHSQCVTDMHNIISLDFLK
jgi:hypothetical protein